MCSPSWRRVPSGDNRARAVFARLAGFREAGTSGQQGPLAATAGLPPDPTELGRPMSDDEKVDEAALESMDASDPPAFPGTGSGAPGQRRTGR